MMPGTFDASDEPSHSGGGFSGMFHPRTLTNSWNDNEHDRGSVNSNEAAASPRSSLGEPYEGWGESPPPLHRAVTPPPPALVQDEVDEPVREIKLDPTGGALSDIE